ncbi:uncharacterized protein C5orf34 homolog [Paramormyrops kingsleyae]|uniref:uncharacterized protein C5orf34 homolog n=1 Tax=Paramormyrops kingsleyae TaxID=1676925 RepID=UPI003B97CAC5
MAAVSFMVLLEDDALEVGYSNGSRLQLSPCGSEFVLEERPPASAHPLQTPRRLRRRTRFVTSAHKELLVQALDFRNRFATRPYLPEELLPMERRKVSFTDISEVEWPSFSEYSSCDRSLGPSREFVISSLDGNARLQLSPWGEEFSVVFLCRVSQDEPRKASGDCPGSRPASQCGKNKGKCRESLSDLRKRAPRVSGERGEALPGSRGRPSSPSTEPPTAHPGRTYLCTWVTQQHSCSFPPLLWHHPLSVAIQLRTATMGEGLLRGETTSGMEKGSLPQALPLRCFSPHQHRWWCRDSTGAQGVLEYGTHDKLLKVMWIQGVLYRVTNSAVTMIEVFPGDGSVIRSSSTLPEYFTHHTVGREGQGAEKTYLLSSLPPDVPGQLYSMRSLVARAGRIMKCYNEAKFSLNLPPSHCCWQEESSRSEASVVTLDPHALGLGCPGRQGLFQSHLSEQSWSAEAELAKIRRFNYLLDHSGILRSAGVSSGSGGPGNSQPEFLGIPATTHEEMSRESITASLRRTSDIIRDIEAFLSDGVTCDGAV